VLATPLGKGGKGGMDRLADLVINQIELEAQPTVQVTRLTTKGGISKIRGTFVFAWALVRFFAMLCMRRVDVLHINLAAYGSFYRKFLLAKMAAIFGVPYVVHIHSGRFGEFWTESGAGRLRAINKFMRKSASIVVLGNSYKELVDQHTPDCMAKVELLPNATPSRERQERRTSDNPTDLLQITFLGLLAPFKGTPQLVEALGRLADQRTWKATLAGHGDIEKTKTHIAEKGLSERIDVPGWLKAPQVDALLSRTDIFVLPSFSEGLPMAILEAFARGVAVIATPVNAIVDVVQHDRNGLLVTPGDVDALTSALDGLLGDEELRLRLGSTGFKDHRAHYAPKPYIERITAIWCDAQKHPADSDIT
jgi:glycosyltransferase involved in cell wall biosynthesis